ncbi:3-hydroxyacyl-CoA dehydrogenase NAD-binding domain-containing protein [Streptosporangium oxazolinicum]|uniref:3-hydroxyacyl-CoA dehydrogenase NAD-binding domain-containing protein n=1 Tax=Streptosporangium oxazolinicum TaxID=909287 RepID=A0ABP8BN22_9ACTN
MGRSVGVLGAGVMGSGIAQALAAAGNEVVCHDASADALNRAEETVLTGRFGLNSAVARGKLSQAQAEAAAGRLTFTDEVRRLYDTDLVVEAVPERLDLKISVFRDLDRNCPRRTVLASNSSGFPVAALAAATDRPDRVIGWHWASPAPVMRLAEIVRGPLTSDATVALVTDLASSAGKNPVVINDAPTSWGYVANRVYFAAVREAARVVQEKVATAEQVDRLMVDCFRWPVGPLAMRDGAATGWD